MHVPPIATTVALIFVLLASSAHAEWESIQASLDLIPNPSLVRPVPLVADTNNMIREISIPQGDIVALRFTVWNRGERESPPMVLADHPLAMPIVIVVVHPDGSARLVPELDPRRRRLPLREQPMGAGEKREANFFIYYAAKHIHHVQEGTYAFPEEGRYEIYAMYDAASAWQKAQAIRDGVRSEELYFGVDGWQVVVNARKNLPLPPVLITNRVIVQVQKSFDGWRALEAAGLELRPAQNPWHKQIEDDGRRAIIEQLVVGANRPWLTQWWNGITDTWRSKDMESQGSDR